MSKWQSGDEEEVEADLLGAGEMRRYAWVERLGPCLGTVGEFKVRVERMNIFEEME